jgi:phosphoribosyl-ATP pyrophosphohydrolase
MTQFNLETLDAIISARSLDGAANSYTASLLQKGTKKCAEKFGEEAVEAVIAAISNDREELTKEAADVLYHLLVLLRSNGVEFSDVMAELETRTARSGHEEKASRKG